MTGVMQGSGGPAAMVDLARYPIVDPGTPAVDKLVAHCRRGLDRVGALALPGFIRPDAVAGLAAEARELAPLAYEYREDHTCYFEPADESRPADHPRRRLLRSFKGGVASDQIGSVTMLGRLYLWDTLMAFVAAALGEERLYRHADPMAALNINVFKTGQALNWHFDRTDFSVTLSLETAEKGGAFEYVPMLRGAGDENYPGVARVIAGGRKGVRRLAFDAGTLALFRGHFSLHRVTPVRGPRPRLAAVLSYVREPNVTFTPYARRLFYGRAAAAAP